MNIGIYDLAVTQKYYMQSSSGSMLSNPIFDMPIQPLLVLPKDKDSNKAPYLISKDNLILDDMIVSKQYVVGDGSIVGYGFDFSRVHSIDKMLHGLILSIQEKVFSDVPDCRTFRLQKEGKVEYQRYGNYLKHWFYAQNELVAHEVDSKKDVADASYTIIPISESFDVDAQEYLIRANSTSGSKTALIWRSVAACIGIEEQLKAHGLHEGSIVYVFDFNNLSNTVSKITMHELNGRLIPGHHLFKRTGQNTHDEKNYPIVKYSIFNDNLNYDFPYSMDSNGLINADPVKRANYTGTVYLKEQPEFLILIGDVRDDQISCVNHELPSDRVYRDYYGESVIIGAGRFANRMEHHIVSYYDECEELSLAIITAEEEVELKTLIKASDKLTGGLVVNGEAIEGIGLNIANPVVDFYLLLGNPGRDVPLKVLTQELRASTKLQNNAKKIPLVLHPSLVAGQGRAKVTVDTVKPEDSEFFQSVDLDWENMKDAVDEKTGASITVEFLEETMERSFPTSLPAVRMNIDRFSSKFTKFVRYIDNPIGPFPSIDIHSLIMPYKGKKKGVNQFIREDIFGSPRSSKDLPINQRERSICKRFFEVLNEQYLENKGDSKYITPISWTYHNDYFPELIEALRKKLKYVKIKPKVVTLQTQELSACSNMLESDSDLILFMEAFFARVHASNTLMGWLRVGYQIVMYNTTFLKYMRVTDFYHCIDDILAYVPACRNTQSLDTVYSFFIFMLKMRRYHNSFCRSTSESETDKEYYTKLMYLTGDLEKSVFLSIVRAKQCMNYISAETRDYHDFGFYYSSCSDNYKTDNCDIYYKDWYFHKINELSWDYFPESANCIEPYKFLDTDFFKYKKYLFLHLNIASTKFRAKSLWRTVLFDYLNGKGNLNLPIG